MHIQLHGYGIFKIDEKDFSKFVEVTSMDYDLFLDIINMEKNLSVVPIISINCEVIEEEGIIDYAHIPTEIGKERMDKLIQEGIIQSTK